MKNLIIKRELTTRPSEQALKKLFEILENEENFAGKSSLKDRIEIWKRKTISNKKKGDEK